MNVAFTIGLILLALAAIVSGLRRPRLLAFIGAEIVLWSLLVS